MIHCGFIGLLGLPNAGKSTFLNKALGEKVAIISEKPQTTRQAFTGVLSTKEYQLILLDAPGYVEPKKGYHLTYEARNGCGIKRYITNLSIVN